MNTLFSSRLVSLAKHWYRGALVAALLGVALVFGVAHAPAAHAASAIQMAPARQNACVGGLPCVTIWATNVNVRDPFSGNCLGFPSTSCSVIDHLAGGNERVEAACQEPGQTITVDGITNNWWMLLFGDNGSEGWTSNIFIVGGTTIAGVPNCNS